jgi:DNA-binding response OmpR family regulator
MRERVLIVEDEATIALLLEDALEEARVDVVGPASTVQQALTLIAEEPPQAALLDVSLVGEHSFPVADALLEHRVPFAFLTGHNQASMRGRYPGILTITKPFNVGEVATLVGSLLKARRGAPTTL